MTGTSFGLIRRQQLNVKAQEKAIRFKAHAVEYQRMRLRLNRMYGTPITGPLDAKGEAKLERQRQAGTVRQSEFFS